MSKKYNILYVDDEIDNLMAFKRLFRRQYNVFITENALEATDLIPKHQIDLVLSDYKMPKLTGVQVLEKISESYPNIARLIVTGYGDLDSIRAATQQGIVQEVISKPWDIETITQIFDKNLGEA
ncbi:MAG: response regulator [Bacteroidota bacterium]